MWLYIFFLYVYYNKDYIYLMLHFLYASMFFCVVAGQLTQFQFRNI